LGARAFTLYYTTTWKALIKRTDTVGEPLSILEGRYFCTRFSRLALFREAVNGVKFPGSSGLANSIRTLNETRPDTMPAVERPTSAAVSDCRLTNQHLISAVWVSIWTPRGKLRSHAIISNCLSGKELYEGYQMPVMTEYVRIIGRQLPNSIFFALVRFKWGPVATPLP
jgi:hypothetical protein